MSDSDILSQSEIDNLLASLSASSKDAEVVHEQPTATVQMAAAIDDNFSEGLKKGYKLYNFRRPDKFSKDHLRALQDIHKEFSRQLTLVLTAYLRLHVELDVVSVDQLTYDEFTRSMPSPITIGIFELAPLPGQILIGISHEVMSSVVDRMLGGVGSSEVKPRELTDIEEALAKKVIERMVKTLEDAWSTAFPVQGQVIDIDSNYSMIQIANPGEIVALITFEVQIANKSFGLMSLCFPYPTLETVLGQLSSQHIFQAKGLISSTEEKKKMLDRLSPAEVDVEVVFKGTEITMQDFLELKEGDVIKLDDSVEDNLVVKINGEKKFLGRPGTHKNHIAVKIIDKYQERKK